MLAAEELEARCNDDPIYDSSAAFRQVGAPRPLLQSFHKL